MPINKIETFLIYTEKAHKFELVFTGKAEP